MDIAARKLELVDWLLEINDESTLEKITALKSVLDKKVATNTNNNYTADKQEYSYSVKETGEPISIGKYSNIGDLENVNDIKNTLGTLGISSIHKEELDKRLEIYKENPDDLLDWNTIKNDW